MGMALEVRANDGDGAENGDGVKDGDGAKDRHGPSMMMKTM